MSTTTRTASSSTRYPCPECQSEQGVLSMVAMERGYTSIHLTCGHQVRYRVVNRKDLPGCLPVSEQTKEVYRGGPARKKTDG